MRVHHDQGQTGIRMGAWAVTAVFLLTAFSGGASATLDTEPSKPDESLRATMGAAVSNALSMLEEYGLPVDPAAARRKVVVSVLQAADPGATILAAEDAKRLEDSAEGILYDTGLRVSYTNGSPEVSAVIEGSPAGEAGIEVGDVLVEVGGRTARDMNIVPLNRLLRSRSPGEIEILLAGEEPEEDPRRLVLDRAKGKVAGVDFQETLPLDLAYLRLNGLFAGTGAEVVTILREWAEEGRFGAVVDLRGAGGADVDSVTEIVSLLAQRDEELFRFVGAAGEKPEVYRGNTATPLGMPLMVLVDGNTVGAAELLAAALADSGRGAMLLGAPTAGDPLVRRQIAMSPDETVYLATRKLLVGGDQAYAGGEGVKPDVLVVERDRSYRHYDAQPTLLLDRRETTEEEKETRKLRQRSRGDVALTRAVDVLLGLKALDIHGFGFTSATR